jgi:predicted lipoprotein with Yx(FWY)xxD motif
MTSLRSRRRVSLAAAFGAAAALTLAACGSSSSGSTSPTTAAAGSAPTTAASAAAPGTAFSTANVTGLGTVVVDGRGRTVYLLTSGGTTNVICDDASGCTKVWPDLALPAGTTAATAGAGTQASLFGTMKLASGESYPTYKGWLMYEFTGDSGPAQGHGEGIHSFGGTWYAISPTGNPITAASNSSAPTPSYP